MSVWESVVSVTTDLGTESGVADFHCFDIRTILPDWLTPQQIEMDCEVDEPPAAAAPAPEANPLWHQAWLCRNAIPIPGLLHVVSNLLNDVHDKLSYWQTFFAQCKSIVKLLAYQPRRERFVRMCILGTDHEVHRALFDAAFPDMYTERWHSVVEFCRSMADVYPRLRAAWSQQKYLKGHGDADGEDGIDESEAGRFSARALTQTLKDQMFYPYLLMVLEIDKVAEGLGSWGERCYCHEHLLRPLKTAGRKARKMRKLTGLQQNTPFDRSLCRMSGKRSWELALGHVDHVISDFRSAGMRHLLERIQWNPFQSTLPEDGWRTVVSDFGSAVAHLEAEAKEKLQFWTTLPWFLCALAAPEEAVARQSAVAAVNKYIDLGAAANIIAHHRVTEKFMSPGCVLRTQLDRFIAGASLSDLPELQMEVSKLAFIPVVERVIEGRASQVRRALRYSSKTSCGKTASLGVRLHELYYRFKEQPGFFDDWLACWERARTFRNIPSDLGLLDHPDIITMPRKGRNLRTKLMKVLGRVLYRTDLPGQYVQISEGVDGHDKFNKKEDAATQKMMKTLHSDSSWNLTYVAVMRHLFASHVVEIEDRSLVYSISLGAGAELETLECAIAAPQQLAYAFAEMGDMEVDDGNDDVSVGVTCNAIAPVRVLVPDDPHHMVFFKIIDSQPAAGKFIKLAPAAGRMRPKNSDLLVGLLSVVDNPDEDAGFAVSLMPWHSGEDRWRIALNILNCN